MTLTPLWWLLAVAAVATAGWLVVGLRSGGARDGSWWRRLAVLVLVAGMAVQPTLGAADREPEPPAPLDVLLVVDRTTSMGAEDYDGTRPRIEGVAADVEALVGALGAARYSVITSDNVARVAAPWTTDASAIVSLARTVGWRDEVYGSGSDIGAAAEVAREVLGAAAQAKPGTNRFVVYLGDGEQTADDAPGSFAGLRDLVDGALVLGYGTDEGGRMKQSPTSEEFVTRKGEPQLSRIDEAALRTIADELGGSYEHRTKPGPISSPLPAPSVAVIQSSQADSFSLAWVLALIALVPLGWELFRTAQAWRGARREVTG